MAARYNRRMPVAGKRVAILIEEGFEDTELMGPLRILRDAGVTVSIVGPFAARDFTGKHGTVVSSDADAGAVQVSEFDALVIPGGTAPGRMRMRHAMVDLARDMCAAGKPVAAICHGPQVLISANVLRGRTVTCWPSIAIDVSNAGGLYVDRPVVRDGNLLTSAAGRRARIHCGDSRRAGCVTPTGTSAGRSSITQSPCRDTMSSLSIARPCSASMAAVAEARSRSTQSSLASTAFATPSCCRTGSNHLRSSSSPILSRTFGDR